MPHLNQQKCSGRSNVLSECCRSAPFGKSHVPSQFRTWVSLFRLFLFDKAIRETRNRGAANRGKGYENRTLLPCLELAALSIFPFKADICSMGEREGNGATRVKRGEGERQKEKGKRGLLLTRSIGYRDVVERNVCLCFQHQGCMGTECLSSY